MKRIIPFLLLVVCIVTSCQSLKNMFGGTNKVEITNSKRINYYKAFLADTVNHAVYVHTIKERKKVHELREQYTSYPEAYIINPKTEKAYHLIANDSLETQLQLMASKGLQALDTVAYSADQEMKKLVLFNTETVFAHDNLFLREEKNQFLEIYVIAQSPKDKRKLEKLLPLSKLEELSTIYFIDLTKNKEEK